MSERRNILELWKNQGRTGQETLPAQDAKSVLVTLVRVEGSSYRKPGARLLACGNTYAGSISGGCLEGEILHKAAWITRSGAAVKTYSTLFDDTSDMPYGLGCGGVVDLLFEPLHLPETQAMLAALECSFAGERLVVATLLPAADSPGAPLQRIILRGDGTLLFASDSLEDASRDRLADCARQSLTAKPAPISSRLLERNGVDQTEASQESKSVFIETLDPPQRLVIFGAGEDARPLTKLAHLIGWRVVVADGRSSLAHAERFPEAESVHHLAQMGKTVDSIHLTADDAAVLLTHSYEQDRALMPQLLPLGLRYLGVLGARHRSRLLLTESAAQLGWTPEECLERVHAPVGLDLGGDAPEAVALAIVAEIQSALYQREIQHRRMTKKSLLDPPAKPYVPTVCPVEHLSESLENATERTQ
ncbi:MAG TPA: XdhC family protein [Acidobacteriaceae bacterium]|jgi:xanthine/CO dehydrogenase XdhC/CoxF family maturation factor|nr:XdhC family protein [Acidobacteriaceae bacterium]